MIAIKMSDSSYSKVFDTQKDDTASGWKLFFGRSKS